MKHCFLIFGFLLPVCLFSQKTESLADLPQILEQHVSILASDSLDGRGLGTPGKKKAFDYIARQFKTMGLEPYDSAGYCQHFDLRVGLVNVVGTNVVGFLTGSDPVLQKEYILVGAHYDHLGFTKKDGTRIIFHGADDNASGVAAVIELARYFATHRDLTKRSLVFVAFDAEESGLLGSEKFTQTNTRFDSTDLKAMFSIDMVGMYKANNGLNFKGVGALANGERMAREVASSRGITLKNTSAEIEAGTDTWPFGRKGIPAMHAYTGKNSPYHKPEDTYEKLDYSGMANVCTFLGDFITTLSAAPELMPSHIFALAKKPVPVRFKTGVVAAMGSAHHDYPGEFYNAKGVLAFNAGVFAQIYLGKRFAIQPELLYQTDGSKTAEGVFRRHSVSVPVNLQYTLFYDNYDMLRIYPFAGGYYNRSFAGKNGDESLDFDNKYSANEWGVDFGLGLDIMKLQIGFTWQYGLTNLLKDDEEVVHPFRWFIAVGYKFR